MSDPSNTWTDERVEMLRKLWGEGLSASQIANEIGGVSRNAVIGKVHRLGLSGRTKTTASQTPRTPRKPAPMAAPETAQPKVSSSQANPARTAPLQKTQPIAPSFEETVFVPPRRTEDPESSAATEVVVSEEDNVAVPVSERVTIMELREYMCRWPMGDPTSPSFRFCGARAVTGMPYCTHHASIAYQPVLDRRRDRKRA